MSYIYAVILGIVQGLTEFLPVSSSGHLVLLNRVFRISDNFVFVSVILHLATFFAVLFCYFKDILELVKHPFSKETLKYVYATVPTVLVFFAIRGLIMNSFSGDYLPFCFMFTAVVLLVSCILQGKQKDKKLSNKTSVLMGFSQGLAIFPGISRSGMTICTGLICKEKKEEVMKFSFIMSLPIILASFVYELLFEEVVFSTSLVLPSLVSFCCAFIVGVFAIKFMIVIIRKAKLYWFSVYLALLSVLTFFLI